MTILQSIENNVLPLIVTFVVATLGITIYNLEYESFFTKRRTINYNSFMQYFKMFNVKINYINIVSISVILLYSLVIFGLFIVSNVVRIYAFVIIPFDAMMILFLYQEITRKNYNVPSIDIFIQYRTDIENILKSKEKTLERIEKIENNFNKDTAKIKQNLLRFNAILPNNEAIKKYDDFLSQKVMAIQSCKDELNLYNESLIKQFNDDLCEFLQQGISPDFNVPTFEPIDMNILKGYAYEYKSMIEEYINSYLIVGLKNGTIKKAEQITEVLEIGKVFNVLFSTQDLLDILTIVNMNIDNKSYVSDYLFVGKYITEENFLGPIIQRDWAWCITETTVKSLSRKQLVQAYLNVIEYNAKNCCNAFLQNKVINQSDVLGTVLASTSINNACTQTMNFHKFIMNSVQEFDDESTKYENMAQALKENGSSQVKSIMVPICASETYFDQKELIMSEYNSAYEAIKTKYSKLGLVLMCYYDGVLSNSEYVDGTKIMKFYMENLKTLNKVSLKYFNILLSSVVILKEIDKKKIKSALNSLKEDMDTNMYDFTTDNSSKESAKKIIRNLLKSNMEKILPIVNRIEKQPLSLDKLSEI